MKKSFILVLLLLFCPFLLHGQNNVCKPGEDELTIKRCVPKKEEKKEIKYVYIKSKCPTVQEKKNTILISPTVFMIKSLNYHKPIFGPGLNVTYLRQFTNVFSFGPGITYARFIYPTNYHTIETAYFPGAYIYTHYTHPRDFDMIGVNLTFGFKF